VLPNTDNVLVREVSVQGEPAVLVVVAHGNYKDNACAYASAAAVVAFDQELAAPLLADADVAPTLRRAMLAADEAIAKLQDVELVAATRRRLQLDHRKTFRGMGCSAIALVVTATHAWIAHVGENRAFLLPGEGPAKQLVHPHVLANDAGFRATAQPEERRFAVDLVMQALGLGGDVRMDVTRVSLAPEDRIVVGNATLAEVPHDASAAGDALVSHLTDRASRESCHIPTTLALIG
jgi:serine/threonine protein phosphatase PrpC